MESIFKSIWGRLIAYFLAGVFALLPLVITVALVIWVIGFLEKIFGPGTLLGGWFGAVNALGWLIALGAVFGLGVAIVEFGAKNLFQRLVDPLIARIPLVGSIYGTSKQFIEMLDKHDKDQIQGMKPVFCRFGETQGAGVLALLVTAEQFLINGQYYNVVIIPTAPVPFGGGLLFMPVHWVHDANMSVDGLMSVYVSMGVTASQFLPPQQSDPPQMPAN